MSATAQRVGNAAALLAAFLLLSGFGEYDIAKQCQITHCSEAEEKRALAELEKAKKEQADLIAALAALREQQAGLATELSNAETTLEQLGRRLDQSRSATAAQKQEFQRLDERRRQLQKDFDRANTAPTPANATDADEKQLELDKLGEETLQLKLQIEALQKGL